MLESLKLILLPGKGIRPPLSCLKQILSRVLAKDSNMQQKTTILKSESYRKSIVALSDE